MEFDQFDFLAILDTNVLGKTMLAQSRDSKSLYAIKSAKKEILIENEEVNEVMAMKKVWLKALQGKHPLIAELYATFQTETDVYFVMEHLSGGSLMSHLQREPFAVERTRYANPAPIRTMHRDSWTVSLTDLQLICG